MFVEQDFGLVLDSSCFQDARRKDGFARVQRVRSLLGAGRLKEQAGNVATQNAEHFQRLNLFLQNLSYLFRRWTRQRPVSQKLGDLLDEYLVIFGKTLIASNILRLQSPENVSIIGTPLLADLPSASTLVASSNAALFLSNRAQNCCGNVWRISDGSGGFRIFAVEKKSSSPAC